MTTYFDETVNESTIDEPTGEPLTKKVKLSAHLERKLEKCAELHAELQEKRNFYSQLHKFLADHGKSIEVYPFIALAPLDLYKLYLEVERFGGFDNISHLDYRFVKWSPTWEKIYSAIVGSNYDFGADKNYAYQDSNTPSCDVKIRRQKLRKYFMHYLLGFVYDRNVQETNSVETHYFRCVCGHTHDIRKNCVTCDGYLETTIGNCSMDHIQCESCGCWQHIQCLIEEDFLRLSEAELFQNENYHFYCEMCAERKHPHSWSAIMKAELPVGWTCERRFRNNANKPGPDYYFFRPDEQLNGRFTNTVIRSVDELLLNFHFKPEINSVPQAPKPEINSVPQTPNSIAQTPKPEINSIPQTPISEKQEPPLLNNVKSQDKNQYEAESVTAAESNLLPM